MALKTLMVPALAAFLLVGCEGDPDSHQKFGTLIGAVGGGLLGAQFGSGSGKLAMVALGTMGGAFLGNRIGENMDQVDRMKHQQAIDSALHQTVPLSEIIVVDDGSTDSTLKILEKQYASVDGVALLLQPENRGQLSCFNAGFGKTSGDVVFFLDADDLIEEGDRLVVSGTKSAVEGLDAI